MNENVNDCLSIDKQNEYVGYNDKAHAYWSLSDKAKYISVTTLIGKFEQEFNKDFWSKYKALEKLIPTDSWKLERKAILDTKKIKPELLDSYGIEMNTFLSKQQDILDEWDITNKQSCERGTKIHADLENSFYKTKKDISLAKYGIGGKFECRGGNLDLLEGIYPEYLISWESKDKSIRLAGQIDLLVIKGNSIIIGDWKGLPLDTKILTNKGFSTMGELKVGDIVYDMNGKETTIIHKSNIHNNPCYKITFHNGESIIADEDHRWLINGKDIILTKNLQRGMIIFNPKPFTVEGEFSKLTKICMRGLLPLFNKESVFGSYNDHRVITRVEKIDTVPTQCIEVNSVTHTYLFGESLIVTHNTNKEIKLKGGFDTKAKSTIKMKYPLNTLDDCNYSHYNLQLSTYAWMVKQKRPDLNIEDLVLVHFDHKDNMTVYHLPYLEREVIRMLKYYKKEYIKKIQYDRIKPIEY